MRKQSNNNNNNNNNNKNNNNNNNSNNNNNKCNNDKDKNNDNDNCNNNYIYIALISFAQGALQSYISDRIRRNMPTVDSETVPGASSVLTTPLARRKPSRMHVTWTPQQGAMSTQNIQTSLKQLNRHSQ